MPRRRAHVPLLVYLNNRLVGRLLRAASGAISFEYDDDWLAGDHALPISLSLPLREEVFRGEPVAAFFENLLPDSDRLRRRIAERVGAKGTNAYSLLSSIGRDCVGALQFVPEGVSAGSPGSAMDGEPIDEAAIEKMLANLGQAPLGLGREDDFRISVAGVQEKTALLWQEGRWFKPRGTTPTTHLIKTQIGNLPNGIDLSDSVENEFYCLKLAEAFGLPVNSAEIRRFGDTTALVVERFDRRWTRDHRLLRLPQEDLCQALSVPPSRKYQSDGGPGLVDVLRLLRGSDTPETDQRAIMKAQLFFWLIGATDGHAKNFSVFLMPGGSFRLTPLYDILTAQPSLDARQIERKRMKLALSVGTNRHYRFHEIRARHFLQSGEEVGLPVAMVPELITEIIEAADDALNNVKTLLPARFPATIHASVGDVIRRRIRILSDAVDESA